MDAKVGYHKIHKDEHDVGNHTQPTVMVASPVKNYDRTYKTKVAVILGSLQIVCGLICICLNVSINKSSA